MTAGGRNREQWVKDQRCVLSDRIKSPCTVQLPLSLWFPSCFLPHAQRDLSALLLLSKVAFDTEKLDLMVEFIALNLPGEKEIHGAALGTCTSSNIYFRGLKYRCGNKVTTHLCGKFLDKSLLTASAGQHSPSTEEILLDWFLIFALEKAPGSSCSAVPGALLTCLCIPVQLGCSVGQGVLRPP